MDELQYKTRPLFVTINNENYVASEMECNEALSGSMQISIEFISPNKLSVDSLGKVINISFDSTSGQRGFCGIIDKISLVNYHVEKEQYFYQITACDILSLISKGKKRRIFQQLTSLQIIEKIISDSNLKQYFSLLLSVKGDKHEYCCQMDESDGDFIRRLIVAEGWNYYHDIAGKIPKIVLIDQQKKLPLFDEKKIAYVVNSNKQNNRLTNWVSVHQLSDFSVSFHDYLSEQNEDYFSIEPPLISSKMHLKYEFYAQNSKNKPKAKKQASQHMEAEHINHYQFSADTSAVGLSSGAIFSLIDHPNKENNADYCIRSIQHLISCNESNQQVQYHNKIHCFPKNYHYYLRYISKPLCHGLQSAEVTGPDNQEIYRDKLGRIKVYFHWDIQNKKEKGENSSCWLNVLQPMAGKGVGLQFLPRVGDTVLVQFINGDPDQPVVVGSFYNNKHPLPFNSPSCSGFKSLTTPNGKQNEGNELSFEDKKENELVKISAQKDLRILAKNDFHTNITGLLNTEVDKTILLRSKEQLNLQTDKVLQAKSLEDMQFDSHKSIKMKANNNINISVDKSAFFDAKDINITGKTEIKLKVGASQITITPSEISIESPQIKINGKAKVAIQSAMTEIASQAKTQVSGAIVSINGSAMTEVKAGAMVQIQGAITKIN